MVRFQYLAKIRHAYTLKLPQVLFNTPACLTSKQIQHEDRLRCNLPSGSGRLGFQQIDQR